MPPKPPMPPKLPMPPIPAFPVVFCMESSIVSWLRVSVAVDEVTAASV